jgi:hypothetical protein
MDTFEIKVDVLSSGRNNICKNCAFLKTWYEYGNKYAECTQLKEDIVELEKVIECSKFIPEPISV